MRHFSEISKIKKHENLKIKITPPLLIFRKCYAKPKYFLFWPLGKKIYFVCSTSPLNFLILFGPSKILRIRPEITCYMRPTRRSLIIHAFLWVVWAKDREKLYHNFKKCNKSSFKFFWKCLKKSKPRTFHWPSVYHTTISVINYWTGPKSSNFLKVVQIKHEKEAE